MWPACLHSRSEPPAPDVARVFAQPQQATSAPSAPRARRPRQLVCSCASDRRAIARVCEKAFPPPSAAVADGAEAVRAWRPAGTPIRCEFGLEAAAATLGHSSDFRRSQIMAHRRGLRRTRSAARRQGHAADRLSGWDDLSPRQHRPGPRARGGGVVVVVPFDRPEPLSGGGDGRCPRGRGCRSRQDRSRGWRTPGR